jgi:hypothetical protein
MICATLGYRQAARNNTTPCGAESAGKSIVRFDGGALSAGESRLRKLCGMSWLDNRNRPEAKYPSGAKSQAGGNINNASMPHGLISSLTRARKNWTGGASSCARLSVVDAGERPNAASRKANVVDGQVRATWDAADLS